MSDPDLVIGIDVAAARPSTAAAVRMGRVAARGGRGGTAAPATVVEWMEADHRDPDQVAALMAWIERHDPAVVAVDALQDYRRQGRRASASRAPASGTPVARKSAAPADPPLPPQRACDRELMARRIRLHPVPSRRAVVSGRCPLRHRTQTTPTMRASAIVDRAGWCVECRWPLVGICNFSPATVQPRTPCVRRARPRVSRPPWPAVSSPGVHWRRSITRDKRREIAR